MRRLLLCLQLKEFSFAVRALYTLDWIDVDFITRIASLGIRYTRRTEPRVADRADPSHEVVDPLIVVPAIWGKGQSYVLFMTLDTNH